MIQFQVPQFIDTEDKIVGPLTLKQFGYIGVAGAISAIFMFTLPFIPFVLLSSLLLGIAGILAFLKINGRPLSIFIGSMFSSIWSPSVYVFKPKELSPQTTRTTIAPPKVIVKRSDFDGIKNLLQKINTTKAAIPKRERALPDQTQAFASTKEEYAAVSNITGEREAAKRVDYR